VLPIPARGLLAVSSEVDDAEAGVRATVSLYRLASTAPTFPQLVSNNLTNPVGWGALSGLGAVPGTRHQLVAVTDSSYSPTKLVRINTFRTPARVVGELVVTDASGTPIGVDAEGVAVRPGGGYWLAVEGATGPQNRLLRLDASGAVQEEVPLPPEVAGALGSQGLEGVTTVAGPSGEQVWVTLQRELVTDPRGVVRIGRYDVATSAWTWFGYPLASTAVEGDWIGLSEITAVGPRTFAVVERDTLSGPQARVKQLAVVTLPTTDPAPGTLPVLTKRVALDVLPALRATNGWTQEKLEGLTVGGDGQVYAVTDNDAVTDATGETVFLRLGSATTVFGKR
jgi:hypothetical protein